MTLATLVGCLSVWASGLAHAQDESETAVLDPRAVAVVPFANISGDPADAWIGVGIAETVTADIEQLGSVSIVAREALLEQGQRQGGDLASGDETIARELGRSLGVSWIIGGGFQRVGEQIRITARIVEVETGAVSQTVKIDGAIDELFALQDRIVVELSQGFDLFAASASGAARRDTPRAAPRVPGNVEGSGGVRAADRNGNGSGDGNWRRSGPWRSSAAGARRAVIRARAGGYHRDYHARGGGRASLARCGERRRHPDRPADAPADAHRHAAQHRRPPR